MCASCTDEQQVIHELMLVRWYEEAPAKALVFAKLMYKGMNWARGGCKKGQEVASPMSGSQAPIWGD